MKLRELLSDIGRDVRVAARGLQNRLAFSVVAVLTLAVGIGSSTAIFSAANTLLLKPLPFREPEGLMKIDLVVPASSTAPGRDDMPWSYPKSLVLRDAQRTFQRITLYSATQFNLTQAEPERVGGEMVDARYFTTLGIPLALGSNFAPEIDERPNAPKLAIISYAFWLRRFGIDSSAVGKAVEIDRTAYQVVAVAARGFRGMSGQADIFVPITTRDAGWLSQPQSHEFTMIGRRSAGVSVIQAQAEVARLGALVARAFPPNAVFPGEWSAAARTLNSTRADPIVERSIVVLLVSVSFVLLLTCTNLASLLLARASARRREIAIRLALGATRARLLRLLIIESSLVALVGGGVGLVIARWGTTTLAGLNPATAFRTSQRAGIGAVGFNSIHLDATGVALAFGISLIVGISVGAISARLATKPMLADDLKGSSMAPRNSRGMVKFSTRRLLVSAQIGIALVLLSGAGLMIRSLINLLAVHPGFESSNVMTMRLAIPEPLFFRDSMSSFYIRVLERLQGLPGVESAALGDCAPLVSGCNVTRAKLFDEAGARTTQSFRVGVRWVTPQFFETLGVPLRRGRSLTPQDRMGSPKVVLLNEAAANELWPRQDPLGKRISIDQGGFADGAEVVGVVGNIRSSLETDPTADVYLPYAQSPQSRLIIFLRTSVTPATVVPAARDAIREVAPQHPVYDVQTLAARTAHATSRTRTATVLLGFFAAFALALAALGIYGVTTIAVGQRTREIGIRMALGADSRTVRLMVLRESSLLVAAGCIVGLLVAFWLGHVLRALLFEVAPTDITTYLMGVLVVMLAAMSAAWAPAARATRVSPITAIRSE